MHEAPPFRERRGFVKMKAIECVCCGWRDYEMLSPRHWRAGLLAIR